MNVIVINTARFVLFVFLQIFIFNQIEFGFGIHLLMCPLYIMLLPFEINIITLMIIAFGMGAFVDVFSNTYGLHASSLLLMAYFRPSIFKLFAPRENYDVLKKPTFLDMGQLWFFSTFGTLPLIHNVWFFMLEAFSFSGFFYSIQKVILSFIFIYFLSLLLQILLVKRSKN
jgi:hypothetical protein